MNEYIFFKDITDLKDNIIDDNCKITYLKRRTQNYFIHIVCCQFSDLESLKKNWKELVNNVSEVVQKKLKDLIEIYNVYIIFFQPQAKESLIYNIEQNKFSSRKIVLTENMPDDDKKLGQIINSKLFNLEIEKENSNQSCFIDGMDFLINLDEKKSEIELKKYIQKYAKEKFNEENK